jgi:hypothetical protein
VSEQRVHDAAGIVFVASHEHALLPEKDVDDVLTRKAVVLITVQCEATIRFFSGLIEHLDTAQTKILYGARWFDTRARLEDGAKRRVR